jgi:predicted glycoside hydrolase/deacetylase ChbG (UPF0249 family)
MKARVSTARWQTVSVIFIVVFVLLNSALSAAQQSTPETRTVKEQKRVRLLVRGDDFGYTHSSNVAMKLAFDAGIMRSASVMVVGPWFAETAAMIRSHPNWTVGVHLTITSEWEQLRWGPVLAAEQVPTLMAPDGYFFKNYWTRNKDAALKEIDPAMRARIEPLVTGVTPNPEEVEAELRAQIKLAQKQGIRIDYIDCHMGAACLKPLLPIMLKLSKELCIPVPEEGLIGDQPVGFRVDENPQTTIKNFRELLLALKPGLYRVVTHPAEDSPELRAVSVAWADEAKKRHAVLQALISPEIRRVITERDIEIVSIRDLWDNRGCRLKK